MTSLPTRLSPAAISRFRTCPKSFWFADVERAASPTASSPALVLANAVHHALERFFGVDPELRSPDLLEQALRAVWPQHRRPGAFASRQEETAVGERALELLRSFAAHHDLTVVPLAREQWVSVRLPAGVQLFGKVDRIDARPDGGVDLIDYKTGRAMLDSEDLPDEPAAQIYLVAAEAALGMPVERVRFLYLNEGLEAVWHPEPEDVAWVHDRLAAVTEAIRKTNSFEASPGLHCRWCAFALRCPESNQVRLNDLVPVEGLPF